MSNLTIYPDLMEPRARDRIPQMTVPVPSLYELFASVGTAGFFLTFRYCPCFSLTPDSPRLLFD
jgi:hypothetical protein